MPGHIRRQCPQTTQSKPSSDNATARGSKVMDKSDVYVKMRLFGKNVPCLLDSGCEMTLIPRSIVESAGKLQVNDTNRRIWAANNTELVIDGETTVPFCVDGHSVPTQALVSPDVEEVMLGSDWLHAHRCVWDFANSLIHIDGKKVVTLSRKGPLMCRRAYVCDDVTLAPKAASKCAGTFYFAVFA